MMTQKKKWKRLLSASILVLPFLTATGVTQTPQNSMGSGQARAIREIRLSFKRDARVVDPFRGIGEWAEGDSFTGANAQETVEIRAAGINVVGQTTKISPQWITTDPEVVTISPDQGDDVKVTVHKAGESKLRVSCQDVSKELVITVQRVGQFLMFRIAPPPLPKAHGPAASEMDPSLKGRREQISYAAGMRLAETLRAQSQEVDPDLVAKAMRDVFASGTTLMSDEQQQMALMGVETELNVTAATVERKKIAEKNRKEAEEFLAANKKKDGIETLPSGLQYRVIKAGGGKKPTGLDVAVCEYTGRLIDGTVFDDSHRRKDGRPVSFPLKAVIKGWQEALRLMPTGSEWQIFVPPDLAYGEHGVPQAKIPPNAALVFDLELLSVGGPDDKVSPTESTQKALLTPQQMDAIKKMVGGQEKEPESKSEKNQ